MAALFKQKREDPLFEYEHVMQPVSGGLAQSLRTCVCAQVGYSYRMSFPFPLVCIKNHEINSLAAFFFLCTSFFEEQCDALFAQLILMCG